MSRKENPISAASFSLGTVNPEDLTSKVEFLELSELPGVLAGRRFDCVVAMDLLIAGLRLELLQIVHELLVPGGEMVFYESNPWNPVHKIRASLSQTCGKRDPRSLISRPHLYELLSEIGFVRIYAVFNDFVYAPLTRPLIWFLRNLSILLENAPVLRTMAGSILLACAETATRATRSCSIALLSLITPTGDFGRDPCAQRTDEHRSAGGANLRAL